MDRAHTRNLKFKSRLPLNGVNKVVTLAGRYRAMYLVHEIASKKVINLFKLIHNLFECNLKPLSTLLISDKN